MCHIINRQEDAHRHVNTLHRQTIRHTVFDLISEHALISGHPPFFVLKKNKSNFLFIFIYFILILIIISSDFREGNTSLLYTGLMVTRALTLRVHLLGRNLKKR